VLLRNGNQITKVSATLARAAVLAGALTGVLAGTALAQSPLEALQQYNKRAEWEDRFDATLQDLQSIKTATPTLAPQTAEYVASAIDHYAMIVQRGGWGTRRHAGQDAAHRC